MTDIGLNGDSIISADIVKIGNGSDIISADYFISLLEFAWEKGVEPQDFLLGTEVPLSILTMPSAFVGFDSMARAVENTLNRIGTPSMAIEYGKRLSLSQHGALGLATRSSENLLACSELFSTYISTRSSRPDVFTFEVSHDRLCISIESKSESDAIAARFYITSLIIICDTFCRVLTGMVNEIVDTHVSIAFESPGEIDNSILPLGMILNFDQPAHKISFPLALAQKPLVQFNPQLVTLATDLCQEELAKIGSTNSISYVVRSLMRFPDGKLLNIEKVAESLNMSSRTLKRKLSLEGTSFQRIKDSERLSKSVFLLEFSKDSINSIAEKLGYSDVSNFNKAFVRWNGYSAAEYRKNLIKQR